MKNAWNTIVKASTWYDPPNEPGRSPFPINDRTATSVASTPANATHIDADLRRGERNRSVTSTITIVADRISTGRIAW